MPDIFQISYAHAFWHKNSDVFTDAGVENMRQGICVILSSRVT
mgnify:CR=1 FL=1